MLTPNQIELLKIAKTLVGLVLEEGELVQDEEENLTHVHHLLDWHTSPTVPESDIKPGKIFFDDPGEIVYDSLMNHKKEPAYPDCPELKKHWHCWFCADRK